MELVRGRWGIEAGANFVVAKEKLTVGWALTHAKAVNAGEECVGAIFFGGSGEALGWDTKQRVTVASWKGAENELSVFLEWGFHDLKFLRQPPIFSPQWMKLKNSSKHAKHTFL